MVAKIFFSAHALVSSAPDFTRVELEILAKKKKFRSPPKAKRKSGFESRVNRFHPLRRRRHQHRRRRRRCRCCHHRCCQRRYRCCIIGTCTCILEPVVVVDVVIVVTVTVVVVVVVTVVVVVIVTVVVTIVIVVVFFLKEKLANEKGSLRPSPMFSSNLSKNAAFVMNESTQNELSFKPLRSKDDSIYSVSVLLLLLNFFSF